MSDLISRSALLKRMEDFYIELIKRYEYKPNYAKAFTMIDELVKEQPTAYDVEQVVKELKQSAFPDVEEEYTCNGEQLLYLAETIDIVKGGGVNERD